MISTRGLKADADVFCEFVFDVTPVISRNTADGYAFAKDFLRKLIAWRSGRPVTSDTSCQHKKRKTEAPPDVPEHVIESLARCVLPLIQAYYDSDEGQREFAAWKAAKDTKLE